MEAIVFSIVVLVAVLVFIGLMGYEVYKETKTDLEIKSAMMEATKQNKANIETKPVNNKK